MFSHSIITYCRFAWLAFAQKYVHKRSYQIYDLNFLRAKTIAEYNDDHIETLWSIRHTRPFIITTVSVRICYRRVRFSMLFLKTNGNGWGLHKEAGSQRQTLAKTNNIDGDILSSFFDIDLRRGRMK